MIFLMLFAILAIGFFAAVTTSTQVARNERDVTDALRAAESGMAFVRQQLSRVTVPAATTGTTVTDALFADLPAQLQRRRRAAAGSELTRIPV
jgi:Tfp pilus assembly protein PilX